MDKTLTIKDRIYSFGTIPALEAITVEVAIARVIGEPLFKALSEEKQNSVESIGQTAIGLITARMDADELIKTMTTVFKYVNCDGNRVEIDSTFTGKNKELWQVFLGALKFNFADFLEGLPLTLGQKEKSESK
jgi:hypothetical protein